MDIPATIILRYGLPICLAVAGGWDLKAGRVPNRWLAFWYGAGLCLSACSGGMGAIGYLGRSLAVVGIFFPLFVCRMMGAGDIKCMALVCGYLGFSEGTRVIGAGMALGAGWGLIRQRGSLWGRLGHLTAYLGQVCRERRAVAYHVAGRDGTEGTVPLVAFLFLGLALLWGLGAI